VIIPKNKKNRSSVKEKRFGKKSGFCRKFSSTYESVLKKEKSQRNYKSQIVQKQSPILMG
jgi:hypothetical protein